MMNFSPCCKITDICLSVFSCVIVFCLFQAQAPAQDAAKPLQGWRICVDPGHGGISTAESQTGGARGPTGLMERDANLGVGLHLRELLIAAGAEVSITRTTDRRMTPLGATYPQELHARCDVAEDSDAHFLVSCHHNAPGAGSDASKVNFTMMLVYEDTKTISAPFERALAEAILPRVAGALKLESRPVHPQDVHVIRETTRPGVLVEGSFITHPEEERRLRGTPHIRAEAEGIFQGILDFCNGRNPADTPKTREFVARNRFLGGTHQDIYVPRMYFPTAGGKMTVLAPQAAQPPAAGAADLGGQFYAYINGVAAGSEVKATWAGKVVYVNTVDAPGAECPFQRAVVIEHPHVVEGLMVYTIYGQLSEIRVWTNKVIADEEVIGTAGDPAQPDGALLFAVRVGENSPAASQNPAFWVMHPQNRDAGVIAGRVEDAAGNLQGGQLVQVRSADGAAILYTTVTYPAWANGARSWHENFGIHEIPPGKYKVVIGEKSYDADVSATRVTYINTK